MQISGGFKMKSIVFQFKVIHRGQTTSNMIINTRNEGEFTEDMEKTNIKIKTNSPIYVCFNIIQVF